MLRVSARSMMALLLTSLVLATTAIGAKQAAKNNTTESTTAKLVSEMISKFHINQQSIDDRVSQMLLKRLLKDFDPQKLYFLKGDVDELMRYKEALDDYIRVGNVDFAHQFFALYLKRLDERIAAAHKLIDLPQDFTVDEVMITDGDQVPWAATGEELNERWRKRIKFDLLSLKLEKTEPEKAVAQLHKRYDTLKKSFHDMESGEVLEMYLSALAHCFDPHSSYMSPQTLEDFQIQMRLSLEGIGAALKSVDGYTVVNDIVAGGAAEKDGRLKVGDKIVAVGQEEGDFVDVVEMKLTRVVRLIRGPGGTKVRLKVVNATGEPGEILLVRQKVELKNQEVKGEIIDSADRLGQPGLKLGVINIPSFYRDFAGAQQGQEDFKSTARDVYDVLKEFEKKGGVDAIIIDLRMNGGGALSEAIEVTGMFIDKGPVVQVKEQNGSTKPHNDDDGGEMAYRGPLVVLCNRLSASASEIFAAAIKDYRRGLIVGDVTTHGKGTVQNVMPVSNRLFNVFNNQNLGALKLTIQQFYRVNGDSTQNRGVESDVVLPSLLDHMDLGESFMENALEFNQINPAQHLYYSMVTPEIVSRVRESSAQRVAHDGGFANLQRDIERYLSRKNRKTVSLNEEQLVREREEAKAADDVAKAEEEKEIKGVSGPIFPKGEYNDEVLHLTQDYVNFLKQANTAAR